MKELIRRKEAAMEAGKEHTQGLYKCALCRAARDVPLRGRMAAAAAAAAALAAAVPN